MLNQLEAKIDYTFKNKSTIKRALTHSSYAHQNGETLKNNERLEFLGDSVLSLVIANHLFSSYNYQEGDLTKLRASLVCEHSLYEFAKQIDLGDYLYLGKCEQKTDGRYRESILADAFEAVIAAIYLDGGYKHAEKFVLSFVPTNIEKIYSSKVYDYKTSLQEVMQKNKDEHLEYEIIDQNGPDHDKTFTAQVKLNSNVIGTGVAKSKKQAQQYAAKEALELMGYET